jgi:hypothetical protein
MMGIRTSRGPIPNYYDCAAIHCLYRDRYFFAFFGSAALSLSFAVKTKEGGSGWRKFWKVIFAITPTRAHHRPPTNKSEKIMFAAIASRAALTGNRLLLRLFATVGGLSNLKSQVELHS